MLQERATLLQSLLRDREAERLQTALDDSMPLASRQRAATPLVELHASILRMHEALRSAMDGLHVLHAATPSGSDQRQGSSSVFEVPHLAWFQPVDSRHVFQLSTDSAELVACEAAAFASVREEAQTITADEGEEEHQVDDGGDSDYVAGGADAATEEGSRGETGDGEEAAECKGASNAFEALQTGAKQQSKRRSRRVRSQLKASQHKTLEQKRLDAIAEKQR